MSNFFKNKIKNQTKNSKKEVLDNGPMSPEELNSLLEKAVEDVPVVASRADEVIEAVPEKKEESKAAIHKAHNIYFDENKRKFMLVTIEYATDLSSVRLVSITPYADSNAVALKKLTDMMSLKLLRGEERVR